MGYRIFFDDGIFFLITYEEIYRTYDFRKFQSEMNSSKYDNIQDKISHSDTLLANLVISSSIISQKTNSYIDRELLKLSDPWFSNIYSGITHESDVIEKQKFISLKIQLAESSMKNIDQIIQNEKREIEVIVVNMHYSKEIIDSITNGLSQTRTYLRSFYQKYINNKLDYFRELQYMIDIVISQRGKYSIIPDNDFPIIFEDTEAVDEFNMHNDKINSLYDNENKILQEWSQYVKKVSSEEWWNVE
ncbi:MAG: hypothetical protein EXQ94_12300 [Alphaproteobacteria bacterium]|nr:hypothetical protein [Alphaproteobacteria bacterium]